MAIFNVQRAINPKVGNPELWFMCSAHCHIVFYLYVKFQKNISNSFKLTERTRVHGGYGYIQCPKGNNSSSR